MEKGRLECHFGLALISKNGSAKQRATAEIRQRGFVLGLVLGMGLVKQAFIDIGCNFSRLLTQPQVS